MRKPLKTFFRNFLLFFAMTACSTSRAQEVINYFDVCGECKAPVIIRTDRGSYEIWGGEVIYGNLNIRSAVDARGNKVVNTTPSSWEVGTDTPDRIYYVFKSVYRKLSGRDDVVIVDPPLPRWKIPLPADCFPNLQANVIWSLFLGEMITLQTDLGGAWGCYMQGGVGRDFFLKNPRRAISWMAEVGIYINIGTHVPKFGLMIAQNQEGDFTLLMVGKYTYYLEKVPWLGFSGALGAGFYNFDGFTWDARAGVTFRFLYSK